MIQRPPGPSAKDQKKAQALAQKALARQKSGAFAPAVKLYSEALALAPGHPQLLTNRGVCKGLLGRHAEAAADLEKAVAKMPDSPVARAALGAAQVRLGRPAAAALNLAAALKRNPGDREARLFLAMALDALGRSDEALTVLGSEAQASPPQPAALRLLALLFSKARRPREAAEAALAAWRLEPAWFEPNAAAHYALRQLADWERLAELDEGYLERLHADATPASEEIAYLGRPFSLLSRFEDRAAHRKAAARHAAWLETRRGAAGVYGDWPAPDPSRPLKVGYLSSDFENHATMQLMAGVFRAHDPARVAIHSYSYGPPSDHAYRRLVEERSVLFRDLRSLEDRAAAEAIRADGLDLLVDLKGYTEGSRLGIAAYRPVRVQATFLGYPGTLGARFIDYAVVDETVAPPEQAADFSEILAYHPVCYQPNDPETPIGPASARAAWGLPAEGVVFASFNQTYKIEPVRFESWMAVMRAVEGSVLWLLGDGAAETALRREAEGRGVAGARLIFAEKVPKPLHLERIGHADLTLDTRLYNGHTTSSDSLLAGTPVVATLGGHFAARVSGSLLRAAGLGALIAEDEAGFQALAIDLAGDPERRAGLRARLAEARRSAPLFDPVAYTRGLEDLFAAMIARGPAGADRTPIRV